MRTEDWGTSVLVMPQCQSTTGPRISAGPGSDEREGLAHDACNLLAAVGLYCDLMSQPGVVSLGHQHYLEEMRRLARRSGALMERLMAHGAGCGPECRDLEMNEDDVQGRVSRTALVVAKTSLVVGPTSTMRQMHVQGVDAEGVDIARLLESWRGRLQVIVGSGVLVEVESRVPRGVRLGMDEEALERVLVNLTVNARDAMPEGGRLRVSAQWGPSEADGTASNELPGVLISVQDSGPGLPAELVARLNSGAGENQRGIRAATNSSHKQDGRGHGLGLAIVRELVEAAGGGLKILSAKSGVVSAKSAADSDSKVCLLRGTRFEITLPLLSERPLSAWDTNESDETRDLFASKVEIDRLKGNDHATMTATKIEATRRRLLLVSPSCATKGPLTTRPKRRVGQADAAQAITSPVITSPVPWGAAIC